MPNSPKNANITISSAQQTVFELFKIPGNTRGLPCNLQWLAEHVAPPPLCCSLPKYSIEYYVDASLFLFLHQPNVSSFFGLTIQLLRALTPEEYLHQTGTSSAMEEALGRVAELRPYNPFELFAEMWVETEICNSLQLDLNCVRKIHATSKWERLVSISTTFSCKPSSHQQATERLKASHFQYEGNENILHASH